MPVKSCVANLFQEERVLSQFLLACQQQHPTTTGYQIVSISQKIETLDPLAVLAAIVPTDQLHFYWENRQKEEAILGHGIAKKLILNSPDRFSKCRDFIKNSLAKIMTIGEADLLPSHPRFFCNFTFFDSCKNNSSFYPATIFLPRFQIIKHKKNCIATVNLKVDMGENIEFLIAQIKRYVKIINEAQFTANKNSEHFTPKSSHYLQSYSPHHFKSAVNSALKAIQKNHFSKIVLADILDVILPFSFNLLGSLDNLRQQYPNCYIFSLSNGQGNNFIGASPERLLSLHNQQLITDALAGSVPRGKTVVEDTKLANQLLRSEKERREHQAVIEFIIQRLHQLGLTPHCSPLKILQLSNIQHLWTPIYAQLPAYIHPLDIVAQLHPTPAVAGVPTHIACQQIQQYEPFDRSLYAAPLGWVDGLGNGEFIVGIRSALIAGDRARLYAGAGIVAGSDPERELLEIKLKFQTLLKALF